MKTTTKILLTISIILGALTTVGLLTINSIDKTESGILINFNNGTGYYIQTSYNEPIEVYNYLNESVERGGNFYKVTHELDKKTLNINISNNKYIDTSILTTNTCYLNYKEVAEIIYNNITNIIKENNYNIEDIKINMALNDQPFIEYKNGEILN